MCEWRLGRSTNTGESEEEKEDFGQPIPLSDLIKCLRTIQKSIPRWSEVGGRRGYLNFVSPYLP